MYLIDTKNLSNSTTEIANYVCYKCENKKLHNIVWIEERFSTFTIRNIFWNHSIVFDHTIILEENLFFEFIPAILKTKNLQFFTFPRT